MTINRKVDDPDLVEAVRQHYSAGVSIKDTALHFGIGKERTSRFVQDIMRPSGPRARGLRKRRQERTMQMVEMCLAGASDADVAAQFGVTRQHVSKVRLDHVHRERDELDVDWDAPTLNHDGTPVKEEDRYRMHEYRFLSKYGLTHVEIAERLNISWHLMEDIINACGDAQDVSHLNWSRQLESTRIYYHSPKYAQKVYW